MAIQQINLGSAPSGAGGDTQRAANTKINQNFSNQAHAVSRLVGTDTGNLLEVGAFGLGRHQGQEPYWSLPSDLTKYSGIWTAGVSNGSKLPFLPDSFTAARANHLSFGIASYPSGFIAQSGGKLAFYMTDSIAGLVKERIYTVYNSGNTTKDVATGFLKASSPVLHVYNDSITKIHEAEQLDITVDKKGVGHYEIHGTTGLRKNDGWFMSPPRDLHGNVLCMIEVAEKDGVVILKTYKKKFDFETVSIVHDYENPMDIPDGACVEFRFNDLPQEQLDEPIE